MKKISLMLVAAATCAFASCGGNKSNNADVTGVDSAIVVTDSDSDNVGTGVQNQANEVTESFRECGIGRKGLCYKGRERS